MITCSKIYNNLPAAHRQHNHDGHCALIHGHDWSFEFEFACNQLDSNGFVVDFGKLKPLKQWLELRFDHTLLLNADDPELDILKEALDGLAKIVIVPNCGAEGLAQWVGEQINGHVFGDPVYKDWTLRNVRVLKLTVHEDNKNSATCIFE